MNPAFLETGILAHTIQYVRCRRYHIVEIFLSIISIIIDKMWLCVKLKIKVLGNLLMKSSSNFATKFHASQLCT